MVFTDPSLSITTCSMSEAWEALHTNTQPQPKVEPLSPFAASLTMELSHSQLRPDSQVEPYQPMPQSQSVPMALPLSVNQGQVVSVALTSAPTLAQRSTAHNSQLPPVAPFMPLPNNHPPQSSRNMSQSHPQPLCNSPPGLQPHQQLGLAHLSDLMTGNLMVNKCSAGTHSDGHGGKPSALASTPNHAVIHGQGNSYVPLRHSQGSSSHSIEDPFMYGQSAGTFYPAQPMQQHQQHHQDDYNMIRGSSSSSSCSTSSSTTLQQEPAQSIGPCMKGNEPTGAPLSMSGFAVMKTDPDQTLGFAPASKVNDCPSISSILFLHVVTQNIVLCTQLGLLQAKKEG